MSAGETPGIRLACPMVVGFILLSFCLASVEIDLSVSNGVLFGMRMSSSREIFSASSFSLSMYPEYFMWISVDSHKSVKSKSGWCSNFSSSFTLLIKSSRFICGRLMISNDLICCF
jgi:hypothetical protein